MRLHPLRSRALVRLMAGVAIVCASSGAAFAQSADRTLGREDIILLGAGLAVEPARQTVPKDIATIVSTFLSAPNLPNQPLPPFAPDAVLKGTLRGPSFAAPIEITTRPNTPFNIPPLPVAGIHTLDEIRLESGGAVLLRGAPETVAIEVIEKLLVTQVTARALTAEEIRARGIVFDRESFQAYNFTAAFAVGNANPVPISFPIVLPRVQSAAPIALNEVGLPKIDVPDLPSLATIIPETLQLQTQIPNLSVIGFTLTVPSLQGQNLIVPPIPGIVVIPGDIGFLNQYFNVTLLVGNVAPIGSNLVVSNLSAEILLPPGRDDVPNSGDDPLRMAQTAQGESQRVQLVVQPGADGRLGTADDIASLGPGDSGSAEYLVEGRREGSHVIEMEMTGTLHGLPVGPVTVRGRAAGSVAVRNPTFTLTFTHPQLINAGEPYTLDVTVSNTSTSPANFVSVNLYSRNITGAILTGNPSREIESIAPGDSATVSFDLIAQITGPVTAATLDSDTNVEGRFALKTSVGELGIPLSPDSLVLPKEANSLPADLRNAALGLLGRAWAVATAPAAALPADVTRFSKQIVYDRAIELAEAGFRFSLHEPLPDTASQLWFDYVGNTYSRLNERYTNPAVLALRQADYAGFDTLRRRSVRGDVLAGAVASIIGPELFSAGAEAFHRTLGEKVSFRPGHISALIDSSGSALPFTLSIVDSAGRRVGGIDAAGRVIKTIPFADLLNFTESGVPVAQLAMLAVPDPGNYRVVLERVDGAADTPFTLSLLVPDAAGGLRQLVFSNLTSASRPAAVFAPADPIRVSIEVSIGGTTPAGDTTPPSANALIADPPPSIIGVVQQKDADVIGCPDLPPFRIGRVIAVLFSEEVSPEAVQDRLSASAITRFLVDQNQIVSVALQPGRRIAFLALRDPVGPLVPRSLTVSGITDRIGQAMGEQTLPIEMTMEEEAGVVSGQVLRGDGTPVPFANVRLFYVLCSGGPGAGIDTRLDSSGFGIASKTADADGRFSWDYVLKDVIVDRLAAVEIESGDARTVPFNIARNGQRLNINLVFLGRGTLSGRTLDEAGAPLANTSVRVTSLTDDTEYGATSDGGGRFTINRIPVGQIFIEAVNPVARATGKLAEYIAIANGTVVRDLTLFSDDQPPVTVQYGTLRGFVLRGDGQQGVADVPVVAYYRNESQRGVTCPRDGGVPPLECAIAVVRTGPNGEFLFERLAAGQFRFTTFERATYQTGEAATVLLPNATQSFNILLAQGLGTVRGVVLDAGGRRVAGARVGGGLALTTTNDNGEFTLIDVPIGRREIVAVSDALHARGTVMVDLVRAGDEQNVAIIFDGMATVAGRILQANGSTPVPNARVHLVKKCEFGGCVEVVASVDADAQGGYTFPPVKLGQYTVSSFNAGFTSGNVKVVTLTFNGQVARADIVHRGGGGRITGVAYDDDGQTPLRAAVGLSGDRVLVAGGQVAVGFQHVDNYAVTQTNFTTGEFAFNDIWVGAVTLRAVGQFSPDPIQLQTAIPSPNATVHVELRLQPTAQIAGTVYQPDGVTPVGADVVVRYHSKAFKLICNGDDCVSIPQGVQNFTVVTDAQGRYLINPVNAGAFDITVEDPATGRVAQIIGETKPGQDAEFDIRLLQLATVTIRVRGSNGVTPISGARVALRQTGFPHRDITLIAGADGNAIFGGANALAEGEFAVLGTNLLNGFAGRVSGRVIAESESVVVDLFLFDAHGSVTGQLFGPDGLTPVPNAEILVSNDDGPLSFAVTDSEGRYRAEIVPLGPVQVESFEAATSRRAFASGQVDLDRQQVPINLMQLGLGLVKGTIFEADSLSPLKNWDVSLEQQSPSGRAFPLLRTASGVDGSYSFPGAVVGNFEVRATKVPVRAAGFAAGELVRHGQIVDMPMVVRVPRAVNGRVEGRVVNPDGTPAANSVVQVSASGVAAVNLTADGDGRFTLESVPVGRVRFTAQAQSSRNQGSLIGEIEFEGQTLQPLIVMVGLTRITGTVYQSDGLTPAPFVALSLRGRPSSGCGSFGNSPCLANADASGRFSFDDVPATTFTIVAEDQISSLKGVVGEVVNPGGERDVRIVLEPSAVISGRIMLPGNRAAQGAVVEVVIPKTFPTPDLHLFAVAGVDGAFSFAGVPSGQRTFTFSDPIGTGVATRTIQVLSGLQPIGDIVLDTGPPAVVSTSPAAAAVGVPLASPVRLVFDEPLLPGTVTAANVFLSFAGGSVAALLAVDQGDSRITLTPLSPLLEKTIYTVTVRNLTDRVGKPMLPYLTSFTSIDLTAPEVSALSPGANTNGSPIFAPVRVTFNEAIDVTRFSGAAVTVMDGAATVEGRVDYAFGNTVIVFTPLRPLREEASYRVIGQPAVDLSGNMQAQGVDYVFTTTDRTAPVITALTPAGNGTVIENAVTQVVASVGANHDVAFVDFYVNGILSYTARTEPFTLNLLAQPELGAPGSTIAVGAVATDTSGNRGAALVSASVMVVADLPPVVTIVSPAANTPFRNGERVNVTVRVTDDLGAMQLGYRAETGRTQDAATRPFAPAVLVREEIFGFNIPATAVPGSRLRVLASALDTKGQSANVEIALEILDAVPPTVTITGTTSGSRVRPGQDTLVVVSAQDAGAIRELSFTATGAVGRSETRVVDPVQVDVATSFSIHIPENAGAGDVVVLNARAIDAAGNITDAAPITLPVADLAPPTVTLRTSSGALQAVPGREVVVIVDAEDETGVSRVDISGQGAFSYSSVQAISPPIASASASFTINVPVTAPPGTTLTLAATATDLFGNLGQPGTLTLTIQAVSGVTLPSSIVTYAGDTTNIEVSLDEPAPAGGLSVSLISTNNNIATAVTPIVFAAGEQTRTTQVMAVSGGSATLNALIQGVQRTSMTVAVQGGVVRGTVVDPAGVPVIGAQVSVNSPLRTTTTDVDGNYLVQGISSSPAFTVKVLDPVSRLIGYGSGVLNAPGGSARLNVALISAGRIGGTVLLPDGETPAGAGVRVDLFATTGPNQSIAVQTVFTGEDSTYEFPLVSLGSYRVDVSDVNGNRGRGTAVLAESGEELLLPILLLGRGVVTGVVRVGTVPVPNAELSFTPTSIFGPGATITRNAEADGTFRFEDVLVGSFTVQAHDPVSNTAGTVNGQIAIHEQAVNVTITLASYGQVSGRVYRADGVTPVSGARVSASGSASISTIADLGGNYTLPFMPLGSYTIEARETSTRSVGRATASLTTHLQALTRDVTFLAQGTVVATVRDFTGALVPNATVWVTAQNGNISDSQNERTDANGVAIIDHVLVGTLSINAQAAGLTSGSHSRSLSANQVLEIALVLEPTANIAGTLFGPDGQTPVTNGFVSLVSYAASVPVGPDGTFRFDGLDFGTYHVYGFDSTRRNRAVATVVLNQAGADVVTNLSLVAVGSVIGRITNPDGSSAGNRAVTVRSLHPQYGITVTDMTDANGNYETAGITIGNFTVSVGSGILLGEATGAVTQNGEIVRRDISLVNSAVTLPTTKRDANNAVWDIRQAGHIGTSLGATFVAGGTTTAPQGGFVLEVVSNGTTIPFVGDNTFGTTEDALREVVVRQQTTPIAGLSVTRKVFVPRSYFARYLELLTNPTAAPITVDVRIRNTMATSGVTLTVGQTSSGDAAIDVSDETTADRWTVVRTGTDGDVFSSSTGGRPSVAWVFDGPGAPARVSSVTFQATPNPRTFVYTWSSVTIQPGETVGFMHFGAQQYNQAAAIASAERLVQLPPEALDGLAADEVAAIRNFAVPANGTSALDRLPGFATSITGRMMEYDGTTPLTHTQGAANTRMKSSLIYFGREYQVAATSIGAFSFAHSAESVNQISLFQAPFTLQSTYWPTNLVSPDTAGSFPTGDLAAVRNIVFSNHGVLAGVVRRHTGTLVTAGGTVRAAAPGVSLAVNIATDGSYRITGLPAATYTLTATLPLLPGQLQANAVFGTATQSLVAGQTVQRDVTINPTGTLTGTLRNAAGTVVPNRAVELRLGNTTPRTVTTSTAGVFLFIDLPPDTYTIRSTDATTGLFSAVTAVVVQDVTTVQDLTYVGVGTVPVTVTSSDGVLIANATISIRRSTDSPTSTPSTQGSTNALGQYTVNNVPIGAFLVRARHPLTSTLTVDVAGTMPENGASVPIAVTTPAVTSLLVRVTTEQGQPIQGARILISNNGGTFTSSGSTNAGGERVVNAAFGNYIVHAEHPALGSALTLEQSGQVTQTGAQLAHTFVMPPTGSVSGRVLDTAGNPVGGLYVQIRSQQFDYWTDEVTDSSGFYEFDAIPAGPFRVWSFDWVSEPERAGVSDGVVESQGQNVQADIVLDDVVLEEELIDGNGRSFNFEWDGQVDPPSSFSSRYRLFVKTATQESSTAFSGENFAISELGGRQLAIWGPNIGVNRLDVTRKVYVPAGGYFVRYLEVFENNTGSPQTVTPSGNDENLSNYSHNVRATSSGDLLVTSADQWWVTGTSTGNGRTFSHVAMGSNGAVGLADVIRDTNVRYTWGEITLQPGERAAILHFVAESRSNAVAQAVAQRLVQLPAEALEGLTAEELSMIRNFDVPADGQSTMPPFPTFSGRVFSGDGVTPLAGVMVRVSATNSLYDAAAETITGSDGSYSITYSATTSYTLSVVIGTTTMTTVTGNVSGQATIVRDVTLTALGGLRGTVRMAGTPVTVGEVRARRVSNGVETAAPIQGDGTYQLPGLAAGSYDVTALSDGRASATARLSIVAGAMTTRDFELAQFSGSVRVRMLAGDGVTILRSGSVYVTDALSGEVLSSASNPDVEGVFTTPGFGAPSGFIVHGEVRLSNFSTVEVERPFGSFTSANQVISVDLGTDVTLVSGVVRYHDGEIVAGAQVSAQQVQSGEVSNYWTEVTGADGRYLLLGIGQGPFVVTAVDAAPSLLRATVNAVLSGATMLLDVTLPPSGIVAVETSEGSLVTLTTNNADPGTVAEAVAQAIATGEDDIVFEAKFVRVPFGRYSVQSCEVGYPLFCMFNTGELTEDDPDQFTSLMGFGFPTTGIVGTLVEADGVTPIPNAGVLLAASNMTPGGGAEYVVTDASGQFQSSSTLVASGLVVASSGGSAPALAFARIEPGVPATVTLTAGTGIAPSPNPLLDVNGSRYEFDCNGGLTYTGEPGSVSTYWNYNMLRLDGVLYQCHFAALSELNGRQVSYAPQTINGLEVTRKVYVSPDGSWVRHIDTLTNTLPAFPLPPPTLRTEIDLNGYFLESRRVLRDPSTTGNTFLVADDGGAGGSLVMADVFAGSTGPRLSPVVSVGASGGYSSKRYLVNVAPGETRILMSFVVQRPAGDQAGAEAVAQSLADLTDPNMLTGLSAAERAQIINFRVP